MITHTNKALPLLLQGLIDGKIDSLRMRPHALQLSRVSGSSYELHIVNCDGEPLTFIAGFNLEVGHTATLTEVHRCFEFKLSSY